MSDDPGFVARRKAENPALESAREKTTRARREGRTWRRRESSPILTASTETPAAEGKPPLEAALPCGEGELPLLFCPIPRASPRLRSYLRDSRLERYGLAPAWRA
ncbi:hypothetical protein KM043_010897 [Ampulex compressa]|nr:hypothetical protein KM043_010897 [Ampulex compressa]